MPKATPNLNLVQSFVNLLSIRERTNTPHRIHTEAIYNACISYLRNMQYNDIDPNEQHMSDTDPLNRLYGVSPIQVVHVLAELVIHNTE